MRKYITYKRVQASPVLFLDPNTNGNFQSATNGSTFYETPYIVDWIFLASVEYPNETTQEQIDTLIAWYSAFEFTFITEIEANTLLATLWEVSVENFIFTDERPVDNF